MKKVRAYITVDLLVDKNLSLEEIKELIAVGKYVDYGIGCEDVILKGDDDFEVKDYVDISINDIEEA